MECPRGRGVERGGGGVLPHAQKNLELPDVGGRQLLFKNPTFGPLFNSAVKSHEYRTNNSCYNSQP